MVKLANRAKVSTSTTGTGTITLGSAVAGFQTFADAGVSNGETVRYVIEDGIYWELGYGVYTHSGTTLTRVVSESSNSDNALTLTGNASVFIAAVADDLNKVTADTFAEKHVSGQTNIVVKVVTKTSEHRYSGTGSSAGYTLDGTEAPYLELMAGKTYRFDQSDSSNSGHPFRFYEEADKTTAYTTGVTTNGTAGSSGAYTQIAVTGTTKSLIYYQCSAHGYMGNQAIVKGITQSAAGSTNLTGLSDVTISGPSNSQVLKYNGSAWVNAADATGSGSGSSVTISDTAPSSPSAGDQWYSSAELKMYIYYNDGDSSQWVQVGTGGGSSSSSGAGVTVYANIGALPTSNTTGNLAFVTANTGFYIWNGGGWYRMAVVNTTPTISAPSNGANVALATDGTATAVEITATDVDEKTTLQYSYAVSTGSLTNGGGATAAISTASTSGGTYSSLNASTNTTNKFFKVTPSTNSSYAGTFSLTFSATDSINTAQTTQNYTAAWITFTTASGSLGTLFTSGRAASNLTTSTIAATGASITFAVQSGSLPAGLSLASNGAISGTANAVGTDATSNFTVRATDGAGIYVDRAFSIIVKAPVQVAFTSNGTWSVPTGITAVEALVVAGGGAGGYNGTGRGTGGGAGGLIHITSWNISGASSYAITIGAGGVVNNASSSWASGVNTTIVGGSKTLTANGGGRGGAHDSTNNNETGGSGGGAWYGFSGAANPRAGNQAANTSDGVNTYNSTGFGNAGGLGSNGVPYGSGGGGAGAAGFAATAGQDGGIGKDLSSEFGTSVGTSGWFASGGAASGFNGGLQSNVNRNKGGGGDGVNNTTSPASTVNAIVNTGGGGGSGGSGGSGIVIIKY